MSHVELAARWLKKAKSDLNTATHMFNDVWPKELDISCYHSQQAVEKALKGYLVYHNYNPPYTHDLAVLCSCCAEFDKSFQTRMETCVALTEYATRTRYPDDFDIEEAETDRVIRHAYEMFDYILDFLPDLACVFRPEDNPDEEQEQDDENQEQGGLTLQ